MPTHCQRPCHYCGGKAGTRDHVVPRVLLDVAARMLGQISNNSVPACGNCNQAKGARRVIDCCDFCASRWALYGPLDMSRVRTITLAEVTAHARAEAV